MTVIRTAISQETDIRGSEHPRSDLDITNEQWRLGNPVGPQGNTASIVLINGNKLTVVGLSGMNSNSEGHDLYLTGCDSPGNNGNFSIVEVLSSSSVIIINGTGEAPDVNNGNIIWSELFPYSLQDDLNYERSDRKNIKGVEYYETVPPYQCPYATDVDVASNLYNMSGKTTDAVAYPGNMEIFGEAVLAGQSKILVESYGQLKHTDLINTLGIPCFDVVPHIGDFNNCFVKVLDGYVTGSEMLVLGGAHAGERIFGVTNNGSSVSPNSVEVVFYSCPLWANINNYSTPYTWEIGQPNVINIVYGYNQSLNNFDFNSLRLSVTIPTSSTNGGGGGGTPVTPDLHEALRQAIHFIDEGPGDGFETGAYKVTSPSPSVFPTNITWYLNESMAQKLVEKNIVWAGSVPTNITWEIYNPDGITVAHTVSDVITYKNRIFESTRVRTIS